VAWDIHSKNEQASFLLAEYVQRFGFQFLSQPSYTVNVLNSLEIYELSPKDVAHLLSMFVQTFKKFPQREPFIDVS